MKKEALDLGSGNINKVIFKLAGPAVGSMFLETGFHLANTFWVGKLGTVSMAAVISSIFLVWIIFSLVSVISSGIVAMISRHLGAKDEKSVSFIANQSFIFSILCGFVLMLLGWKFSYLAFNLMGTEKEVTLLGLKYLRIIFAGSVLFFLLELFNAFFRASGDTRTPLLVSLISISINIILDPFLIFGWGFFPRLETGGAAIATIFSQFCGILLYAYFLKKRKLPWQFSFKINLRIDWSIIYRITKIGIPYSISGILFSLVYLFLNKITALFGTEAIAALGIGNRMESLSYMTCFGFSIAAATLVGYNLGANKASRAEKSAWQTMKIAIYITGIVSVVFLLFSKFISQFFISDWQVEKITVNYLRILALSQIFMAMEIILEGAFTGAGNTVPAMIVSVSGSIARIPLAYFLAIQLGLGVNGVWWAITSTSWAKGVAIVYWFKKGRWKTKKI
jgi:putative MATE family efflux protein